MISDPILNLATKNDIARYCANPVPVMALVGPAGSGKGYLADYLAEQILKKSIKRAIDVGDVLLVAPAEDKQEISLESVRLLIKKLSLKAADPKVARIVLIKDAHLLTNEAQNSLLKTLEQPNSNTIFIMTLPAISSVLPTIISRIHVLNIKPVPLSVVLSQFDFKQSDVQSAWQMSKGKVGLLSSLLTNDDEPLKAAVNAAKEFLKMSKYSRAIYADKISREKHQLLGLLEGLSRVLEAANDTAIKAGSSSNIRILDSRKKVLDLRKNLLANASAKLVALELVNGLKV